MGEARANEATADTDKRRMDGWTPRALAGFNQEMDPTLRKEVIGAMDTPAQLWAVAPPHGMLLGIGHLPFLKIGHWISSTLGIGHFPFLNKFAAKEEVEQPW